MFLKSINLTTNQLGALAESKALVYYTEQGFSVYHQFSGHAPYDLIVDKGDGPLRVSVKSSQHLSKHNSWIVKLDQKQYKGDKPFDNTSCDIVLIYLPLEDRIVELESCDITVKHKITIKHKLAVGTAWSGRLSVTEDIQVGSNPITAA